MLIEMYSVDGARLKCAMQLDRKVSCSWQRYLAAVNDFALWSF